MGVSVARMSTVHTYREYRERMEELEWNDELRGTRYGATERRRSKEESEREEQERRIGRTRAGGKYTNKRTKGEDQEERRKMEGTRGCRRERSRERGKAGGCERK